MILDVLRFTRLPMLIILIYAIARFAVGLSGIPYGPRGNASASVLEATLVSTFLFGALSHRAANFSWVGTLLVGVSLGLFSQLLIMLFTVISHAGNLSNSYYIHWDALNIKEADPLPSLGQTILIRAGGFIGGPVLGIFAASLGRVFSFLGPSK